MSDVKQAVIWPGLTVIVTTYNVAEYISQALDSLRQQTYPNLSVLVVDDGSTDRTVDLVQGRIDSGERIELIKLEANSPGGVAFAANKGLEACETEFVGFLDGDDFCEPWFYENLMKAAISSDADIALSDYSLFLDGEGQIEPGGDSERFAQMAKRFPIIDQADELGVRRLLTLNPVPWRKVYRASFLARENIRFPESDIFWEDNPFHWFVTLSANRAALVETSGYFHRMNRVGATMSKPVPDLLRIFEHGETIRAWLSERGASDNFVPLLGDWAISQFEWISNQIVESDDFFAAIDSVAPFIVHLSDIEFEAALERKGLRTYNLMKRVHRAQNLSFEDFVSEYVGTGGQRSSVTTLLAKTRDYVGRHGLKKAFPRVFWAISVRVKNRVRRLSFRKSQASHRMLVQEITNDRFAQEVMWRSLQGKIDVLSARVENLEKKANGR